MYCRGGGGGRRHIAVFACMLPEVWTRLVLQWVFVGPFFPSIDSIDLVFDSSNSCFLIREA